MGGKKKITEVKIPSAWDMYEKKHKDAFGCIMRGISELANNNHEEAKKAEAEAMQCFNEMSFYEKKVRSILWKLKLNKTELKLTFKVAEEKFLEKLNDEEEKKSGCLLDKGD